jgi:hypothetical protein
MNRDYKHSESESESDGDDTSSQSSKSSSGSQSDQSEYNEIAEGVMEETETETEPMQNERNAPLCVLSVLSHTEPRVIVQRAAQERIHESDPLVIVVDAAVDEANTEHAKEALSRLLHCLADASVARRVTILCAGTSDVLVLHPSEPHVFPLVSARSGVLLESIGALSSALNQRVVSKNVPFIAKTFHDAAALVRTTEAAAATAAQATTIPEPRLIPALRLAARVLSHVATRTDHAQVLVLWSGGRDGLVCTSDVTNLVPAFVSLGCSTSISCVALGTRAPLDVLGAVTSTFDGLLTYASDTADAGSALTAVMRFLSRRPTPLLLGQLASDAFSHNAVYAALGLTDARIALSRARTRQLLGEEDADEAKHWTWLACAAGGTMIASASASDDAASQFFDDGLDTSTQIAVADEQTNSAFARSSVGGRAISILATMLGNADDSNAPAAALASLAALDHCFASIDSSTTDARCTRHMLALARQDLRGAFVYALECAQHPLFSRITTLEDQRVALDALECDTSVLDAKSELALNQSRWINAQSSRAEHYRCALGGNCDEPLGIIVTTPADNEDANTKTVLWAPFHAHGFDVWNTKPDMEVPEPVLVGPPILTWNALSASASAFASDQLVSLRCFKPTAEKEGEHAWEQGQEAESRSETRVAHDEWKQELRTMITAGSVNVLPVFLQTSNVSNAYVSVEASKALAKIAQTPVWRDPLLCARVHGGLVGRWLLFAAGARSTDVTNDVCPLPPPPNALLIADVCRTLALAGEAHLVADMFARFVRGTPAKEELSLAQQKATEEASLASNTDTRARDALALLQGGKAWRGADVCSALSAMAAILALWRNAPEHERARTMAVKERVDAELKARKQVMLQADEKRIAEHVAAEKKRRIDQHLPLIKPAQEKALRRKLKTATKDDATNGAALDDDTEREQIQSTIVDVDVSAHVKHDMYKIKPADVDALCEALCETSRARGWPEHVCNALAHKTRALYDVGDKLVFCVPSQPDVLVLIANVFGI